MPRLRYCEQAKDDHNATSTDGISAIVTIQHVFAIFPTEARAVPPSLSIEKYNVPLFFVPKMFEEILQEFWKLIFEPEIESLINSLSNSPICGNFFRNFVSFMEV